MPFKLSELPTYPVKADMWDDLANEKRPVLVYGMGNGADKLFKRLEKYGVDVADVFASDGFVRGHSYKGFRVKSFSEIKESYSDFVILLSFASRRDDVLSLLSEIDREYDLYIPDMPVADEEEYFDKEFYNANYREILKAYERLSDKTSKDFFANLINYKLSGKMCFLEAAFQESGGKYILFEREKIRTAIDLGAYNGDTAREMAEAFPSLSEIHAVEADAKTYKRLLKYAESETRTRIFTYNAAVWQECGEGSFSSSGNRNSTICATPSYQHTEKETALLTVDSLGVDADYIKLDVEGAELEALIGSRSTVLRCRPVLSVSAYHKSKDIFFLLNYLLDEYPFYKVYLRRQRCVPAWEIDLIFVPT